MKEFSLVKQLRAKTKCAVTWFYDSCVPFWPKIEGRVLDWLVFLIDEHHGSGVSSRGGH
jgi:hypothetical protein